MSKKELAVAALRSGTVIDRIPADVLFKVVKLLGLHETDRAVTIGFNLPSASLGKKGIIKIADTRFSSSLLNRIAVIAPTAVINIIEDYEVVDKHQVCLPDEIVGIVRCPNAKCITRNEPMKSRFSVLSTEPTVLKCRYCEHEVEGGNIELL